MRLSTSNQNLGVSFTTEDFYFEGYPKSAINQLVVGQIIITTLSLQMKTIQTAVDKML